MTDHTVLSAIESEIIRIEGYLSDLRQKVHAALAQVGTPDSGATPNSVEALVLPVYLTTKGAFHPRGFWFRGNFQRCEAYIDIYMGLLRAIAQDDVAALPRTATELHRHGRTRTYLATNREKLFSRQTAGWAREHSRPVADGWFADDNLGLGTMKNLMRRILRANSLREGTDVVILWDRTPVRAARPARSVSGAIPAAH